MRIAAARRIIETRNGVHAWRTALLASSDATISASPSRSRSPHASRTERTNTRTSWGAEGAATKTRAMSSGTSSSARRVGSATSAECWSQMCLAAVRSPGVSSDEREYAQNSSNACRSARSFHDDSRASAPATSPSSHSKATISPNTRTGPPASTAGAISARVTLAKARLSTRPSRSKLANVLRASRGW